MGEEGAVAAYAEEEKVKKCSYLDQGYYFKPGALKTTGAVRQGSIPIMKKLGHRIRRVMGGPQSFVCLMQRFSVAVSNGECHLSAWYTEVFRLK